MYMDDWSPPVGKEFKLIIKRLNRHNGYAVAIKFGGSIFGHVPHKFLEIVYYFIKWVFWSSLRKMRSNNFLTFTWSTNRAF